MPRVNLYVRDADVPTWERARAYTKEQDGDSLSAFVAEAITELLDRREQQSKVRRDAPDSMETIDLRGFDWFEEDKPRKVRFTGAPAAEYAMLTAYITRAGQVVVVRDTEDHRSMLLVFRNFEEFESSSVAAAGGGSFVLQVAEALGRDYAEEID